MRVTTIALPIEMHRRLVVAALDRRTVLTELVRQAVTEWFERHDPSDSKRRVKK